MARRGGLKKYMDSRLPSSFKIQITSMVDMFVILLVFLLKSFSTSPVTVTPKEGLQLPQSTAAMDPVDVVKMVISQNGVFVEDKRVADIHGGRFIATAVDASDQNFVRPLYEALDERAKMAKSIAKVNETFEFDGKILVQADRNLSYELLQKVMYTSMLAGYSDVKFAVISNQ